jgi:hypothetical protein
MRLRAAYARLKTETGYEPTNLIASYMKSLINEREISRSPSLQIQHHRTLHFQSLCPKLGMKLLWLALCSLGSLSLFLAPSTADKQGSFQIYSDSNCAIQEGTPIPLLLDSCQPINKASAITAVTFPSCGNGKKPILYGSDQEDCARPSIIEPSISSGSVGQCLFFATGTALSSAAFICVGDGDMTTVSPTEPGARSTTSAAVQPTANNDETPSSPGLSITDRIALGCGIGIGIPVLVVLIFTLWKYLEHQRRLLAELRLWRLLAKHRLQWLQRLQDRLRWPPVTGNDDPPPYELHAQYP